MLGTIPPLPQYVFMAWHLGKHRDFTFTVIKQVISKYIRFINPECCKS